MGDCIKRERIMVAKQAPSVTERPIRTFMIRSLLFRLWHPNNHTSTPLPSQPCWTTCSSPTHTLNSATPSSSALCLSEPPYVYSFSSQLPHSYFSPAPFSCGEFDDPLWPASQLAAPPSPTASGTLLWSAAQSSVSSPAVNSYVNKQVPPGRAWIFVSPSGAPSQPLPYTGWYSKIK